MTSVAPLAGVGGPSSNGQEKRGGDKGHDEREGRHRQVAVDYTEGGTGKGRFTCVDVQGGVDQNLKDWRAHNDEETV